MLSFSHTPELFTRKYLDNFYLQNMKETYSDTNTEEELPLQTIHSQSLILNPYIQEHTPGNPYLQSMEETHSNPNLEETIYSQSLILYPCIQEHTLGNPYLQSMQETHSNPNPEETIYYPSSSIEEPPEESCSQTSHSQYLIFDANNNKYTDRPGNPYLQTIPQSLIAAASNMAETPSNYEEISLTDTDSQPLILNSDNLCLETMPHSPILASDTEETSCPQIVLEKTPPSSNFNLPSETPEIKPPKRAWTKQDNDHLMGIINRTFPGRTNINWKTVYRLFNDPSVSQEMLRKKYYPRDERKKTSKKLRTQFINEVIKSVYGGSVRPEKIDWNLITKKYKERHRDEYKICPQTLKNNFEEHHIISADGTYQLEDHVVTENRTEQVLFWTKEREDLFLNIVLSVPVLARKKYILWREVQWAVFNKLGVHLEIKELREKYEELKKQRNFEPTDPNALQPITSMSF